MNCAFFTRFGVLAMAALVVAASAAVEKVSSDLLTSSTTKDADSTPVLRLNEILVSNQSVYANGDSFPDVIELFNAGASALDLSGKRLGDTDDATAFSFPTGTTIAAGGYLLVFADDDNESPGLHTGFALDSEGDEVFLYDSVVSGGALIDSLKFGFQISDLTMSRTAGDASVWGLTAPTLGAANGDALATGDVGNVVINEWSATIKLRTDKDFIELYNPSSDPVGLGDARVTDDLNLFPKRYEFRKLSYIPAEGFLLLDTDKLEFSIDNGFNKIFLAGSAGAVIDQIDFAVQPEDHSTARSPDGSASWIDLGVPTPGISNTTTLPAEYRALLDGLRITEIMFEPVAGVSAKEYEFVELTNIGATALDLSGVRFTNGIRFTFAAGTTLAPGAQIVVARNRSIFLSRYPIAVGVLAAGNFEGALDNSGETIALTLPTPWDVHALRFRYEPDWYTLTSTQGYSLVVPDAVGSLARDWDESKTWSASALAGGNPGGFTVDDATTSDARLLNLSTRGRSLIGADALVPGFVLGGAGTKRLLIRAVGPTLANFGVPDVHADPSLTLKRFDGVSQSFVDVASNDDWSDSSDAATLTSLASTLGAFALDSGSADAAIVADLSPGSYTVVTGSPNGATGTAIVELYDADSDATAIRLLNISTRGFIEAGSSPLVSGFVISEEGPRTVLIRAIGPTLGDYGVTGALADSRLTLFQNERELYTNDNWADFSDASGIVTVGATVGAFALDSGSADAAMLVTLAPGVYTARADSSNTTSGIALIEIYLVP